jgi:hypothetical protein
MMSLVTERSVVVAHDRQVSSDLDDEAVILHLDSGVYYALNEVGATVWSLLREPRAVPELEAAIMAEYEVDAARCRADLLALLDKLAAEDLIEVREGVGDAGR